MSLCILEKCSLQNTSVAEIFLTVPGYGGGAPRDEKPVPYMWTSTKPFRPVWHQSIEQQQLGSDMLSRMMYTEGVLFVQMWWGGDDIGSRGCTAMTSALIDNPLSDSVPHDIEQGFVAVPPFARISADSAFRKILGQVW